MDYLVVYTVVLALASVSKLIQWIADIVTIVIMFAILISTFMICLKPCDTQSTDSMLGDR